MLSGETLLSFDVGTGLSDFHAWRREDSFWTAYDTHIVYRDGIASFTVSGFSRYALAAVREPSTRALFGVAALGLLAYAWRRRKRLA